jgi:Fungal N-terminal domain of STAND proteins
MIDPFTLATGIASLINITLELSKVVNKYTASVKHAPKEVHELSSELVGLGHVLQQLAEFLQSEDAKRNSFDETSVLFLVTTNCHSKIKAVLQAFPRTSRTIETQQTSGRVTKPFKDGKISQASSLQTRKAQQTLERLIWPFKEREIKRTVEVLSRYTQTFQLSLTTRGW